VKGLTGIFIAEICWIVWGIYVWSFPYIILAAAQLLKHRNTSAIADTAIFLQFGLLRNDRLSQIRAPAQFS